MTDLDAFNLRLDENPADHITRLVMADWLEENERSETCSECHGSGMFEGGKTLGPHGKCFLCGGGENRFVSNGYAKLAEGYRMLAEMDCVPRQRYREVTEPPTFFPELRWAWWREMEGGRIDKDDLPRPWFEVVQDGAPYTPERSHTKRYETRRQAEEAAAFAWGSQSAKWKELVIGLFRGTVASATNSVAFV